MIEKELLKLVKGIRKLSLSKKMTLAQLAAECDFENFNMARIEKGKTNPTYKILLKVANALSLSISELVNLD